MKTIDEAAKNSFDRLSIAGLDINWIDFKGPFRIGVEFAQRWISVEDELPEITTLNNHNAVNVKFKTIHGDEQVCTATLESVSRHCGENSPMHNVWYVYPSGGYILRNVTHWRPIELK